MKKALVIIGAVFVLISLAYAWDTHRGQFLETGGTTTFSLASTDADTSEEISSVQGFRNLWWTYRVRKGAILRDSLDLYVKLERYIFGRWATLDSVMLTDSTVAIGIVRAVANDTLKAEKLRFITVGISGNDVDTANTVTGSYFLRE
jgi:hypothetical protein